MNFSANPWIEILLSVALVNAAFEHKKVPSKPKIFLVQHYTIQMDIIRHYLLPNFTALKLCNKKYEMQQSKK